MTKKYKLFDSHAHITDKSYAKDLDDVLQRAENAGIQGIMIVGVTERNSESAVRMAESLPRAWASVGIHPHDASSCNDQALEKLENLAKHPKVRAWGETGLDFNRMRSPQNVQEKWFIRQLQVAAKLNLPVIFHERDSDGRFLSLLKKHGSENLKGIVHCFSGNRDELKAYLNLGLYIGITGILTHKSRGADLRRMVSAIPDNRILLETDAPYLTPSPERNRFRRNEPAFVRSVFDKLCEVKQMSPDYLADRLLQNTCTLFGITL